MAEAEEVARVTVAEVVRLLLARTVRLPEEVAVLCSSAALTVPLGALDQEAD